ncbi:protein SPEAR1-like [Zingiber officinale]|uniref:protein SPEAR1-like n=1 Tax=Zingiber officinale TaxID=94328 RepID=UPI001C4BFBD4|nr:protein SPEAR1-like [Zingiber officinale]
MEGGRSYLQRLSLGSGSRSSSSSRKGKKNSSNSSEKPKQPQRGLGVAQLEKIRLQDQMKEHMEDSRVEILRLSPSPSSSSNLGSSLYAVHPSAMIGYNGGTEKGDFNYRDYGPNTSTSSQGLNSAAFQYYSPPSAVTLPLFENYLEDSTQKMRHDRRQSMGSITQNSDSKKQELDLELRLSL